MTEIDLAWARPEAAEGETVEQHFLLMASCGFDAEVVARLAAARRGAISHASYLGPILSTLGTFRAGTVRLEIGGGAVSARAGTAGSAGDSASEASGAVTSLQCVGGAIIANSPRYAFGINPVQAARLDDGVLDAALLPGRGGIASLLLGARCIAGFRPRAHSAEFFSVHTDPAASWQLDGDPAPWGTAAAVRFGLRRRAVRILLPAPRVPGEFESSLREALVSPPMEWTLSPFD